MLNKDSAEPLYVQARNILLERINKNEYPPNEKIPSESQLCAEFGISRMTLRNVITELVRDGIIYRITGKGTFVAKPKITTDTAAYVGIREQLEAQGYAVETQVLEFKRIISPDSICEKMGLKENKELFYIKRLRSVENIPLSLHISYIPTPYCDDLEKHDLRSEQLCRILSTHYGLIRKHVTQTLESVQANNEESALLKLHKGSPLLLLCDNIYSSSERLFEYSTVVFRGDKVKINLHYQF